MRPDDKELERIIADIRNEEIDPAAVEQVAGRVWELLAHAPLRTCSDFRALMPGYRAGKLPEARALLLKDHTHECVACRKALEGAKVVAFPPEKRRFSSTPYFRWAVAAALALTVGLSAWQLMVRLNPGKTTVEAVDGTLYRVSGQGSQTVAAGAELTGGGELRTARDSNAAVRLSDGSQVEVRERSAFTVFESGKDLTVHLSRGSIIVQAAKRSAGHLYVATPDCRVAVTGTVFSVNSGAKGSRVSVVEGEVHVAQGAAKKVLHRGDQYVSSAAMTPMPVRDDIAWSRNFERHAALLGELAALQKKLEQVRLPELRYASRIVSMLPADTVVYMAIPNLGGALGETQRVFEQGVEQSPLLRDWWQKFGASREGRTVQAVVDRLRAASEYLGDEIVVAVPAGEGRMSSPLVLAEVKRNGFREFLEGEISKLAGGKSPLRMAESVAALGPAGRGQAVAVVNAEMFAMSPDGGGLQHMLGGGFQATPFGQRVAESYRDGAGILFAADLERMGARNKATADLKYAIVEQKQTRDRTDTHAVLAFGGPRSGVFSWLAKPAPIGALDYISPEASLVSAAAVKSPAAMFDEIVNSGEALKDMARTEAELGINIRADLAAPLGGEFAFAVDGPALPVPAWKLVVEVYDAAKLQATIQKIVEAYNRHAAAEGKPAVQLAREAVQGRVWYKLVSPALAQYGEAAYTFADGYLVAAPSRALAERALQYRSTGYTLTRSAAFTALVPRDRHADFSAVMYHNLGSTLGTLLQGFKGPAAAADFSKPMLITAYGEDDRITLATTASLFGLSPANLMRMAGPLGMLKLH